MNTKRTVLLFAIAAGCSSSDETTVDVGATDTETPELVTDDTPPDDSEFEAAVEAAFAWQWAHTPRPPFADIESAIDGFPGVDDALLDEAPSVADPDGDVEKGRTPIVWGWAVRGAPQAQDGDTIGEYESGLMDHCTQFGLACDGEPHSQASDTGYTGGTAADFADELQGRCGRYDSTVDNAWKPCILPYGKAGQKAWTWAYDVASCGLESAQFPLRDIWLNGFRIAATRYLSSMGNGTDPFSFTETTNVSTANIVLYCSFNEIPAGKIALGYPYGNITLRYAADHIFDDWCESGQPGQVQLHAYHFADMYYTYNKGRIGINWADFWSWIQGCGGSTNAKTERVATIMMHELGHVMGFAHAQLPATNWMYANKTCSWALNAGQTGTGWRYYDALNDYAINTTTALQIYDEDISCYSPTGGGETPHD